MLKICFNAFHCLHFFLCDLVQVETTKQKMINSQRVKFTQEKNERQGTLEELRNMQIKKWVTMQFRTVRSIADDAKYKKLWYVAVK